MTPPIDSRPPSWAIVGFTSGKNTEITEEEGFRLQRLLLDPQHHNGWFQTQSIYGADMMFKIDKVDYMSFETEDTEWSYNKINDKLE